MGALTSIADAVIPDWFIYGGGPKKKDNNPEQVFNRILKESKDYDHWFNVALKYIRNHSGLGIPDPDPNSKKALDRHKQHFDELQRQLEVHNMYPKTQLRAFVKLLVYFLYLDNGDWNKAQLAQIINRIQSIVDDNQNQSDQLSYWKQQIEFILGQLKRLRRNEKLIQWFISFCEKWLEFYEANWEEQKRKEDQQKIKEQEEANRDAEEEEFFNAQFQSIRYGTFVKQIPSQHVMDLCIGIINKAQVHDLKPSGLYPRDQLLIFAKLFIALMYIDPQGSSLVQLITTTMNLCGLEDEPETWKAKIQMLLNNPIDLWSQQGKEILEHFYSFCKELMALYPK